MRREKKKQKRGEKEKKPPEQEKEGLGEWKEIRKLPNVRNSTSRNPHLPTPYIRNEIFRNQIQQDVESLVDTRGFASGGLGCFYEVAGRWVGLAWWRAVLLPSCC